VEKKEACSRRFWIIPLAICSLLIFTVAGFATETARNSLGTEKNSEEDKLEFSLELTPANSLTIGQLNLSQMTMIGSDPLESQPFVLSEPAPAPAQERIIQAPRRTSQFQNSLYTSSLITLTALNVADYLTTVRALKHKELAEANPVMQPIAKNIYVFTAVKLGVAALDIYILKKLYKKNKPLGWVLSVAANFAMSYVVANNIRMIKSVQ
jgi:hypothetical protein